MIFSHATSLVAVHGTFPVTATCFEFCAPAPNSRPDAPQPSDAGPVPACRIVYRTYASVPALTLIVPSRSGPVFAATS